MTRTELAHLAGLLDAIGRVRIRLTPTGTRLAVVAISSPDVELLRHCSRMTGVRVATVRRNYGRLGCSVHCEEPHLHVESVTGRWELVGIRAVIVLRAVRPYLVRLGPEVDAVLAETADAPRKPATLRKMADLGWKVAAA